MVSLSTWPVRLLKASMLSTTLMATVVAQAELKDEEKDPPIIKVESGNPLSGKADAIKAGGKLYKRWCRQCHGAKLDGYAPRWGKHGADLRKFRKGYRRFALIVFEGRPKKFMPAHKKWLDGTQVLQIGAFIETKAIKGANWK